MADFVKTITNRINLFGIDNPNKWGTMLWGDNWGYGNNDLIIVFNKYLSETITLTDSLSLSIGFSRTFTNSVLLTGDMSFEGVSDPAGYNRVFGDSTNAENRPLSSYNSYSVYDATFTTATNTLTTWIAV